jgi:hypothetical protein
MLLAAPAIPFTASAICNQTWRTPRSPKDSAGKTANGFATLLLKHQATPGHSV